MTRVVAGTAGGRRLAIPPGSATRPTSERVREAMFSTLTTLLGGWKDVAVLDLYAGSGALGLEALSRGAARCTFVESDRRAIAVLEANVASTGLGAAIVTRLDVRSAVSARARTPVDLVLLDPPYALAQHDLLDVLTRLVVNGWLADDAVVVVERPTREPPPVWPAGLVLDRERRYGDTRLWYLRAVR